MTSWFGTVGVYLLVGVAFQLVLRSAVDFADHGVGYDSNRLTAFAPAMWTFLIFGAWGFAVECMARVVFPPLVGRMSPRALAIAQRLSGIDFPAAVRERAVEESAERHDEPAEPEPTEPETAEPETANPARSGRQIDWAIDEAQQIQDYRTPDSDLELFRPPTRPPE